VDAVILAAGRNVRLSDLVHEFHKPLIERGDSSLIRDAVELAHMAGVERPVVVVSPVNAAAIDQSLNGKAADLVVQRYPAGPGDALRVGLAFKPGEPSDRVLVLLSDNVTHYDDVANVCAIDGIGVRWMHHDEAERFTWYDADERRWREKEPVPNRLPQVACWVGPFVGHRVQMEHVLRHALPINGEYLIGPYLDQLTNRGRMVKVTSRDVGTPESYQDYVKGR
jgi:hypothetical protein